MEYSQLAESCWDPTGRRPTAHIIHSFCRTEALDREALLRLARSSRVSYVAIEAPTDVACRTRRLSSSGPVSGP